MCTCTTFANFVCFVCDTCLTIPASDSGLYSIVCPHYIILFKLVNQALFFASSWSTGGWSECSRSCNGGLRTREVLCKRRISGTEEKVLDDSACTPVRPSLTEPCSNHSCPPEWLALDWSEVGRCLPSCMWSACAPATHGGFSTNT